MTPFHWNGRSDGFLGSRQIIFDAYEFRQMTGTRPLQEYRPCAYRAPGNWERARVETGEPDKRLKRWREFLGFANLRVVHQPEGNPHILRPLPFDNSRNENLFVRFVRIPVSI